MDNIFAWLKQNPEAAGALLGVGGGALYGGLSSLFQDEEERAPLQSALTGALGGGLLGLGGGLAYRHLPGLLSRYGGEEKPLPNNPWSEMLGENKPSPAQGKLPVEAPWDPREFSFSPSPDFDPKPPESVIQKVEALSGGDPVIRAKLMGKWRDASQQTFDNDLADKMPDVVTPAVAGGAIGGGLPLAHKGWRAMRPANWKDLVRGIGENNPDTDLAQLRESVQNRPAVGNAVVGNVRKSMLGELTPKIPFRPSQRAQVRPGQQQLGGNPHGPEQHFGREFIAAFGKPPPVGCTANQYIEPVFKRTKRGPRHGKTPANLRELGALLQHIDRRCAALLKT
jgi:hypothetical protein